MLPYTPRSVFMPYHERRQRWAAIVAHRRCGKTVGCLNDKIKRAITLALPHGRYAYVAPFLAQAKEVAWEYLKRYAAPIIAEKNEAELWIELVNQARIRIHGADNPDRLRGAYLDGCVLDEYADMRPSVWGEVIRPMLADRQGWATFIGTPKGRNAFYEIHSRALTDPNNWFSSTLRASETGILAQEELDDARRDMTPEQYEQEFECSFDAAILGAYYGKEIAEAERQGRFVDDLYDPALLVHTVWDLGVSDSTAIILWQASAGELRVIGEYENHGYGLSHYVDVLNAFTDKRGKPYRYGDDWVPHDAKVKELGTGRTRIETLIDLSRKPKLVPGHNVDDGINAGRMIFNACWFERGATQDFIEALRQYRRDYDEKTRAFKNKPRHDWTSHRADAWRYLAMAWKQMAPEPLRKYEQPKGVMDMTFNEVLHHGGRRKEYF